MSERKSTLPILSREGKPRERGITIAIDSFGALDKILLNQIGDTIDFIKIGQSLPLLLDRTLLLERIRTFHDLGIKVMSGGTLLEVAQKKGILLPVLDKLKSLGFDTVEISESAGDFTVETKREISSKITSLSMDLLFEVGKKDVRNPPSISYLISKVEEAKELKSSKVIIEAGGGKGVGIYNSDGEISWDALNELVGRFGPPYLIFEAPERNQRINLVLEFGPGVNIANVKLDSVLDLEMQRLGLTSETLGLSPSVRNVEGSPAVKFIYHLIRTEHPIDQLTLMQRSGLPKRTLQAGLSYLIEQGVIREISDMTDLRRHKYTPR